MPSLLELAEKILFESMIRQADSSDNPTEVAHSEVEVVTPGRLHFGMLSFGQPLGRSFGGLGAMVAGCGITVRSAPALAPTLPDVLPGQPMRFISREANPTL